MSILKSVLGNSWVEKPFDERLALTFSQKFELNDVLSRVLAGKNVALDEVEEFLDPRVKTSLPDPFELLDMDVAVENVVLALENNKKITIFADYDVDGATSSAVLKRFFRMIGVEVDIYVPDRVLEGYGPNSKALLKLKEAGTDLVITVDCGTVSFEPLEAAHKAGLDVIVIDHHIGATEKPKALAVVNPNRIDEKFEHKNICAATVCFLFAVAINKTLRERGFYHPPLEGGSKSSISGRGQKSQKYYSESLTKNAKSLRQTQTDAEGFLWHYLRNKQLKNFKFKRQQPIGDYVVDFVCLEAKVIIELDGSQHLEDKNLQKDQKRDNFLRESGYEVLRFFNDQVFKGVEEVLDEVLSCCEGGREVSSFSDPALKSKISLSPKSIINRFLTTQVPQGEGNYHPPLEGGSKKPKADSGRGQKEPNLISLLDLVALGTVCDVMPLKGVNRALVAQGLKIMRQRKNLGIRALCDVAGLDEEPAAYHLGFVLGPRVNAGGRVGSAGFGADLLSTEDENRAADLAAKLDEFNARRKDIEVSVLEEAQNNLEKGKNGFSAKDDVIFAVSNGWHQGVIGIVASRLKEAYQKPVAVIALENGKGKASCRSITGIDFGGAILGAKSQGLLIEGGGHAMAGGFSIEEGKITDLHRYFQENFGAKVRELLEKNVREFDLTLDLENVNLELIKSLKKLEPYGTGNKRPKFVVRNLRKLNAKVIGKDQSHISCNFSSLSGVGFAGNLQAVAFRSVGTALEGVLLDPKMKKAISLVGDLNINSFMGTDKVQMIIEDVII